MDLYKFNNFNSKHHKIKFLSLSKVQLNKYTSQIIKTFFLKHYKMYIYYFHFQNKLNKFHHIANNFFHFLNHKILINKCRYFLIDSYIYGLALHYNFYNLFLNYLHHKFHKNNYTIRTTCFIYFQNTTKHICIHLNLYQIL